MSNEMWAASIGALLVIAAVCCVAYVFWQNRRRFRQDNPPVRVRPRKIPVTHGLSLGVNGGSVVNIMNSDAPHGKIVLGGWNMQAWKWDEEDYLEIFTGKSRSTRYRIDEIARHAPSGWFSVKCTFSPRGSSPADGS